MWIMLHGEKKQDASRDDTVHAERLNRDREVYDSIKKQRIARYK